MIKKYTVLAYKSSGSTSCRGCTMDEWDSDFEFQVFDTAEDATKYASKFKAMNMNEEHLGSYDITFLIDGEKNNHWDFELENDIDLDNRSSELAKEIDDIRRAKKEQLRLDRIKQEEDRRVSEDLKLLEKLQKIYGNQS